jgi:hypothetical protein
VKWQGGAFIAAAPGRPVFILKERQSGLANLLRKAFMAGKLELNRPVLQTNTNKEVKYHGDI